MKLKKEASTTFAVNLVISQKMAGCVIELSDGDVTSYLLECSVNF